MKSGVYRITNRINGNQYIGQSKDIRRRWFYHINQLRHDNHGNPHLQNAWNKYGNNVWMFEILEDGVPEYELLAKEREYIEKHKPEYNIADNKYARLQNMRMSKEDADNHPIYKFGDANNLRPGWHSWVYGGARNPVLNGRSRRQKS